MAKRLRAPQEAEVTGGSEMSASQVSQAIHQLRAQAVLDHQWMRLVEETVTQHAEVIDDTRMKATQLKADTVRVAQSLQQVATDVEENDTSLKQNLDENDQSMKQVINNEVALLKKVIEEQAKGTDEKFAEAVRVFKGDISRMDQIMGEMRGQMAQTPSGQNGAIEGLYAAMDSTKNAIRESQVKIEGMAGNFEARLSNLERAPRGNPEPAGTEAPGAAGQQRQRAPSLFGDDGRFNGATAQP